MEMLRKEITIVGELTCKILQTCNLLARGPGERYFIKVNTIFYLSLGLQSQMAWAGSGEKAQVRESDPGPNQRIPTRSQHATKVPP